jgi:hypothetical protein
MFSPLIRWPVLLIALALLATGCGGAFQVSAPEANQVSSQEFSVVGDKYEIEIVFTKDVDLASISPQVNARFTFPLDSNAPMTVGAGSDSKTAVFTTVGTVGEVCEFTPDCGFSVTLQGSGSAPIKSSDGDALDGDNDGSAGGDYTTAFVHVG